MGTKKDIGKAIKESLFEFKDSPNTTVWENIELELKKEDDDKYIIPFWLKIGAGVFVLLLGYFTINQYLLRSHIKIEKNTPKTIITNTNKTNNIKTINSELIKQDTHNNSTLTSQESDKNSKTLQKNNTIKAKKYTPKTKQNLANSENTKESNKLIGNTNLNIASSKNLEKTNDNLIGLKTNESNANNTFLNDKNLEQTLTKQVEEFNKINDTINKIEQLEDKNKIEETNKKQTTKDTLKTIKKKKEKWSLTASTTPTFYGSITKGSSLDSDYINNSKSNQFSFNYGLFINYHTTNEFLIRTGILKTNVNYTTNIISTTNSNGNHISIYSITAIKPDASALNNGSIDTFISSNDNISLTQKISYYEIPLEAKYNFKKAKKTSFSAIGGFSYLIQESNVIEGFAENTSNFKIGEANNLQHTNFSINLGTGFNYKIAKKLLLSADVLFKYHIATYKTNYGNFRPYTISLQAGLTYTPN